MPLPKPCLTCGVLSSSSFCPEHIPHRPDLRRGRDRSHVGRGAQWDALSKRARALQDWCSDCGTREDLTADHLPSAWHKIMHGQAPSLRDVEVCCRSCNARRGPAQPGSERFAQWAQSVGLDPQTGADLGETRGVQGTFRGHRAPGVSPALDYTPQPSEALGAA